jgi:hypothetical protein
MRLFLANKKQSLAELLFARKPLQLERLQQTGPRAEGSHCPSPYAFRAFLITPFAQAASSPLSGGSGASW